MTLTIPADVRAKAEIYEGDAAGQEKTRLLLQETGLPGGLLPLKDIVECGYVAETGYVWLKQRRRVDHFFPNAGRHVSYGAEVSAVAEKGRLRKITGVKAKEMLLWVNLYEIAVDEPCSGRIHCKAIGGITRSFPVDAFVAPDAGVKPPPVATGCLLKKNTDAAAADDEEQDKKEEAVKTAEEKATETTTAAAAAAVDEKTKTVQTEAVSAKN